MVQFCDVSAFQPGIDWAAYGTSQDGVVVKATEGVTYVSETFADQRAGAHAAGLQFVGIYHFARPESNDPVAEARHFCETVGQLAPDEFAVLDIESGSASAWPAFIIEWCPEVQRRLLGRTPIIYMSESPAKSMPPQCARWPLWVAGYVRSEPTEWEDWEVGPWDTPVAWQWTSSGHVPGWGGDIDRNIAPDDFLARIRLSGANPPKWENSGLPDPQGRSLAGVHPVLRERMRRLHERHQTQVNSGWRSSDEQERLYSLFLAGEGSPANRPGTSNHEAKPYAEAAGLAVDAEPVDGDWDGWHAAGAELRLHFPIASEPWHAQPVEVEASYYTGFPDGWFPPHEEEDMAGAADEIKEQITHLYNRVGNLEQTLKNIERATGADQGPPGDIPHRTLQAVENIRDLLDQSANQVDLTP